MRKYLSVVLVLALGCVVQAGPPVDAPAKVKAAEPAKVPFVTFTGASKDGVRIDAGDVLEVPVSTNGKAIQFFIAARSGITVRPQHKPGELIPYSVLLLKCKVQGTFDLLAWTCDSPAAVLVVTVGPPIPVPPGPGPVPPGPTPGPTPIPGDGFRALIVYETADLGKMPKDQELILYSQTVRDYLNSKAAPGPDGKTKEWRIFDKDVSTAGESKTWQDAMKRDRKGLPWIILSGPKGGFEGPLPANVADAMALIKKYAE